VVANTPDFHRRRRQAGTSVVEMAIVLPLLLLLVFAIAEFGVAFAQWQTLTNAVREGTRTAVVLRVPCDEGTVNTDIDAIVDPILATAALTGVNITRTGICDGTGTNLTLTAIVPYTFQVLPGLTGISPSINLAASSTMRNE
jgi:Flp pilus assembly protein TadG